LIYKYNSILQNVKELKTTDKSEQQTALSEDTNVSVSELHRVFIKAELSTRTSFKRSYKYFYIHAHTEKYINTNSKQFSSIKEIK